ncbi:MAG: hypothetical protein IAE78_04835 [Myxococcus sp.]|nr:hypothetical protein [Myxococcus sp.]
MLLSFLATVVLSAPPVQGQTIRVPKPATFGATAVEAEAVQAAVKKELEAEGYGVLTSAEAKGHTAIISGTLTKVGGGYIVNLSIIRESDHRVLDQVREEAKTAADLPRASTEVAKRLAAALRQAMGVRATIKLK